MANHRAAAARLLLMASLLVAVAFFSEADARPNKTAAALRGADDVRRTGRNDTGLTTVHRDADGRGYKADAAAAPAVSEPDCDDDKKKKKHRHKNHHKHPDHAATPELAPIDKPPHPVPTDKPPHPEAPEMAPPYKLELLEVSDPELTCDTCGHPKPPPKPEPPCSEPKPEPPCHEPEPEPPCSEPEPEPPCSEPEPEPPCSTCGEPEMTCSKVHGVQAGETCYSVGQCAELSQDDFLDFNPNIDCDNLFVGQWVCLEATCA